MLYNVAKPDEEPWPCWESWHEAELLLLRFSDGEDRQRLISLTKIRGQFRGEKGFINACKWDINLYQPSAIKKDHFQGWGLWMSCLAPFPDRHHGPLRRAWSWHLETGRLHFSYASTENVDGTNMLNIVLYSFLFILNMDQQIVALLQSIVLLRLLNAENLSDFLREQQIWFAGAQAAFEPARMSMLKSTKLSANTLSLYGAIWCNMCFCGGSLLKELLEHIWGCQFQ